jgi:predicted amidohydrolase
MTARSLRVAAVTMDGVHEPATEVLPRVISWLRRSTEAGAEVVLFPECTVGHYFDEPVCVDGAAVGAVVDAARTLGVHVGIGIGERAGDERYSSYLLLGPEGTIGRHRRTRWQTPRCPIDLGAELRCHPFVGL